MCYLFYVFIIYCKDNKIILKIVCLKIIYFMYWCIWYVVLFVIFIIVLNFEELREGVFMVKVVSLLVGSVDFKLEIEILFIVI